MIKRRYENKIKFMKGDPLFDQELDDVIKARFFNGKDKVRPVGRRIIQRKIIRHRFWPDIKADLKIADFVKETDAQMLTSFSWFTVIIVAFVAILVFAGMIYAMGLINNALHDVGVQNDRTSNHNASGYVNLTQAAEITFGQANSSIQNLRVVAVVLIFSMILSTILINFAIKVHPSWFFVYLMIMVLAILLSAPISNAYQTLLVSDVFGGILPSFTGANWIMINLPMVVAIGGILGGIFLFVNIIRGTNEGNLV